MKMLDEHADRVLDVVNHFILYSGSIALVDAKAVRLLVAQKLNAMYADEIAHGALKHVGTVRVS